MFNKKIVFSGVMAAILLGVGAANAAQIASKDYVDALGTAVNTNLTTNYYNKTQVYNKTEVDQTVADIVAGSVDGLGNLAALDTVDTAQIEDEAVTTDKLAADIVTSLGKADSAVQPAAIANMATTANITSAINSEVIRADAAYAEKALETTVSDFQGRAAGFATAAQGALADTALQSAALNAYAKSADVYTKTAADSAFAEKALETTVSDFQGRAAGFATAAQGALADTALQSAALNAYAKSADVTTEIGAAIDAEEARADAAYAEKALETTVSDFQGRAAGFATAAQGTLAGTAVQPAGLTAAIDAEVTRADAAYIPAPDAKCLGTQAQCVLAVNKSNGTIYWEDVAVPTP